MNDSIRASSKIAHKEVKTCDEILDVFAFPEGNDDLFGTIITSNKSLSAGHYVIELIIKVSLAMMTRARFASTYSLHEDCSSRSRTWREQVRSEGEVSESLELIHKILRD